MTKKLLPAIVPSLKEWEQLPLITFLVAAWNEEAYIEDFLSSFCDLDYPNKELILAAGGTDGTFKLAEQWIGSQIILLEQQMGEGKYAALQRVHQFARGTVIFLTDADCVLDDTNFQQLIYPIVAETETVVTGRFCPLITQRALPFVAAQWMMERGKQIQGAIQHSSQPTYTPFLVGANCALARSIIEVGWRNPLENSIGEDYYLALQIQRMGQRIRFSPENFIQTRYPVTISEYILRKSRWHRSGLLHHYHLGDQRWMRNCLSACRFLALLSLPLLPLFFGLSGLATWSIVWTWYFVNNYQTLKALCDDSNENDIATVHLYHLFLLMVADFCAWAIVPVQMLVPSWRKRW